MPGNDDFLASFHEVEKTAKGVLRLKGANGFHSYYPA